MSLISFIKKIIASVAKLWQGLPVNMKTAVGIGVAVAQNIKTFVDSPPADLLTVIIPGTIDDRIKDLLRARLPHILNALRLVDATSGLTDPNEIAAAAIKVIQEMDGDVRSSFLHNISILVAQVAADGKLTWSDGVYLLEYYYKEKRAID